MLTFLINETKATYYHKRQIIRYILFCFKREKPQSIVYIQGITVTCVYYCAGRRYYLVSIIVSYFYSHL